MAKTKSTYNKKRSMRRSTRKAGMFGFSSEPKSWEDLAKSTLKKIGKPEAAADAGAVAAMAQSLFTDATLKSRDPINKKRLDTWSTPMKVGGKRRRSKRSTKKAGNATLDYINNKTGLAYAGMQNAYDSGRKAFGFNVSGGKRRRSKKSTRKRGKKGGIFGLGDVRGSIAKGLGKNEDYFKPQDQGYWKAMKDQGGLAVAAAQNIGDSVKKRISDMHIGEQMKAMAQVAQEMGTKKKLGGKRRSKKTNKKRSRKH